MPTTGAPRVLSVVRSVVLLMVFVTVPFAWPGPGAGARGVAIIVTLALSALAWAAWMLGRNRLVVVVTALTAMGACGGALAGLMPLSTTVAIGCVVCSASGVLLSTAASGAITAQTVAAFLIASLLTQAPAEIVLGYPLTFLGMWAFGLTRHAYLLRAVQAERTLAETRRAREAETHAAALAERARIAREIHDVLAHSLAAVSVNLQAAEGLLAALPDESPELARAIECVSRAGVFTREGLADARRAIMALRADAPPLPEQLATLTGEHQADGEPPAEFTVTGEPRPVAAEVGLAAYRTVQEALTNARKHAAGQPVRCDLDFSPTHVTVRIVNTLPPAGDVGPLAATGAGYGLTGLRERAALSGGTLTAGPVGETWQVCLRIPA